MKKLVLLLMLAISQPIFAQTSVSGRAKLNQMILACEKMNTAVFNLKRTERIGGSQIVSSSSYVRLQVQPQKIYLRLEDTKDEGVELLYVKGQNNNQVLVNPNGFPYINVNFSPYSERLRKDSHHTITEAGFSFFGNLIKQSLQRGLLTDKQIFYEGLTEWQGKSCEKIVLRTENFGWKKIVLKTNESASSLAMSLLVSGYAIMEKNNLDYGTIKAGTTIWVPNMYAKEITLLLDINSHLPLVQEIKDDKGLYERYEFSNLILNPVFGATEFTKDCKLYHF